MTIVTRLDRALYPRFSDNWDDKYFRERILEILKPTDRALDIGAGAGIASAMNFRGLCAEMCGLDPDTRVTDNPYLDKAFVGHAESMPFQASSFDVVFANNVLEHIVDPARFFAEVARVMKPGASFLFKTPNKLHYVPAIAALTPQRFHVFYNRLRGRRDEDTFPTYYRANTPSAVRRAVAGTGLSLSDIHLVEGRPEYLRLSAPTYLVGFAYERAVNSTRALAPFRVLLQGRVVKPGVLTTRP